MMTNHAVGTMNLVSIHQSLNDLADIPNGRMFMLEQPVSYVVTLYVVYISEILTIQHHNNNLWMNRNSWLMSQKM
jgi:hypothetical protein